MDILNEIPKPPEDNNVPPVTQKVTKTKGSWMNYFVYLLVAAIVFLAYKISNISNKKDEEYKAQLDSKDKTIQTKESEIHRINIDCNLTQLYWIRKYDSIAAKLYDVQDARIKLSQPTIKTITIKSLRR